VVTNNPDLDKKIRMLRDHGQAKKYFHQAIGWNARMDGLQGAVLSVKLKYLDLWNETRRSHAKIYSGMLSKVKGVATPRKRNSQSTFSTFMPFA